MQQRTQVRHYQNCLSFLIVFINEFILFFFKKKTIAMTIILLAFPITFATFYGNCSQPVIRVDNNLLFHKKSSLFISKI